MKRFLGSILLIFSVFAYSSSYAQQDPVVGVWMNESGKGKIKIYKAKNNKFYGKLVWLKEPLRDGKPKLDIHNPDESKQDRPIQGLVILKDFEKDGKKKYEDGTIYDPKSGKTYSCVMTLDGDVLDVRGYVGFSFIGRSTTWTRSE